MRPTILFVSQHFPQHSESRLVCSSLAKGPIIVPWLVCQRTCYRLQSFRGTEIEYRSLLSLPLPGDRMEEMMAFQGAPFLCLSARNIGLKGAGFVLVVGRDELRSISGSTFWVTLLD